MPKSLGIPSAYSQMVSSLAEKKKTINNASRSFATGLKNPEMKDDISGSLLSQSLVVKRDLIHASDSIGRNLDSMLRTHQEILSEFQNVVGQMNVISLAMQSPQSDEVRAANEITFTELQNTARDIANNASFGGIKLMDGTFGSANQFTASNAIFGAAPTKSAALSAFVDNVTHRTGTLTVAVQPNAGDLITIGTGLAAVTFTFVNTDPDASLNQIAIGGTTALTALNLLEALQGSTENEVKKYSYSVSSNVITISELAVAGQILTTSNFNSSSNGARINQAFTAAAATAFDTSYYTGSQLLGQLQNFSIVSSTASAAHAATWENYYGAAFGGATSTAAAANAGDRLVQLKFYIGDDEFNGYTINQNGGLAAGVDNLILAVKTSDDVSGANLTGKVFAMRGTAAGTFDFTTLANSSATIAALEADAALVEFKQNRYMTVNTLGLTEEYQGMSATFNSSNFTSRSVNSVTCTSTTLTINILDADLNSEAFTYTVPSSPSTVLAGTAITLTGTSGDTIRLVLPGDLDFSTETKREDIASSLAKALGASGNSTFIIGTSIDQTLIVDFQNLKWDVLTGGSDLSIANQSDAKNSNILLDTIINTLGTAKAKSATFALKLMIVRATMETTAANLHQAIEEIQAVDVVENYTKQTEAVQSVQALIAALGKLGDAVRSIGEVLRN